MKKLEITKEKIKELYWKKGYSLDKCGDFFGVSNHTILDKMIKLGIPRRDRYEARKININEKELKRLYIYEKRSMRECGEYLSVSMDTIRRRLSEFKIPRRKCNQGGIPWNKGKKGITVSWSKGIKAKDDIRILNFVEAGHKAMKGRVGWNKGLKGYMAGSKNANWKGGKIKVECNGCGKILERHPSLIYRRNDRVWCKKCFKKGLYAKTGEESPNWKGGRKAFRERQRQNIKFILNSRIRAAISGCLKRRGGHKQGRGWEKLVGYNFKELERRLKRNMPENYIWQDFLRGKLQLDHIIPIKAFNFTRPEHTDFKRCWALSNLRLLPAKENMIKGAKLDRPFQPALRV